MSDRDSIEIPEVGQKRKSEGQSADAGASESSQGHKKPREEDPHRLSQRKKQIEFGKNTTGYDNYCKAIPKSRRRRGDPQTPDIHRACSKRAWDGLVKIWRKELHKFDDVESALQARKEESATRKEEFRTKAVNPGSAETAQPRKSEKQPPQKPRKEGEGRNSSPRKPALNTSRSKPLFNAALLQAMIAAASAGVRNDAEEEEEEEELTADLADEQFHGSSGEDVDGAFGSEEPVSGDEEGGEEEEEEYNYGGEYEPDDNY